MAFIRTIKRVKGGVVHFAAEVSQIGHVVKWVSDQAKAISIPKNDAGTELIAKVAATYRDIANAGVLTVEPGAVAINDAAKVLAAEEARKKAESEGVESLRARASRFDAAEAARIAAEGAKAAVEKELADVKGKLAAAETKLGDAAKEIAELKKPKGNSIQTSQQSQHK